MKEGRNGEGRNNGKNEGREELIKVEKMEIGKHF